MRIGVRVVGLENRLLAAATARLRGRRLADRLASLPPSAGGFQRQSSAAASDDHGANFRSLDGSESNRGEN